MRLKINSRGPRDLRAPRKLMENVRILFARPLKIGQCEFLGIFHLPSKFSMGFYLGAGLRPKYGRFFFFRQRQCIKNQILHALP